MLRIFNKELASAPKEVNGPPPASMKPASGSKKPKFPQESLSLLHDHPTPSIKEMPKVDSEGAMCGTSSFPVDSRVKINGIIFGRRQDFFCEFRVK